MKRKNKRNIELILNRPLAITTGLIANLLISLIEAYSFYKILLKVTNYMYSPSMFNTMLITTPIFFIGTLIVLLLILLISQKD